MSDQSRNRNDETQSHGAPGKRLAKKTKPELTPAQAQKKKEKIIMIAMIVLAVIMVIAAAAVLLYNRWVKKPTLPPEPGQTASPAPAVSDSLADPSAEPTLDFDAIQPKVSGARRSEDIYTFFVFGRDVASGSTDTMMVGTYDVTNQKATVMSLPRDTLVNVRSGSIYTRLNTIYSLYGGKERGREALLREVSELVGFTPDYYVQVDWELVGEMVDAIGGVWFDNPYHMDYFDPDQDLRIYQEQGYRKLTGDDAMQIVRWRHNSPGIPTNGTGSDGSDLSRLRIQHSFLKAVLKQTLQIQNVTRIGQLAELFGNRVESNLSVENIFWFAQQAIFGGLQVDDVEFTTMPYYGFKQIYVYPNQSSLLTLINENLNPYVEQVTIRQLDLISANSDGTLRSSTGQLADPRAAVPPAAESDDPEESDPLESGEPTESGEPQVSDPVSSDPPPAESQPITLDPPAQPTVDAAGGGPVDGNWGDTPD